MAVTNSLTVVFDRAKGLVGLVGSAAWGPLLTVSRTAILSLFKQIETGQLIITDQDGVCTVYGSESVDGVAPSPNVELKINRESFWVRLALFADMVRSVVPIAVIISLRLRGRGLPRAICWVK